MKTSLFLFLIFAVSIGTSLGQGLTPSRIEFIATDKDGNVVTDLTKDELVLRIDGQDVPFDSLAVQLRPEVTFALAIDSSGSLRTVFDDIRKSARAILAQSAPGHEAMLMRFVSSDKIQTTQGFSADKSAMMDLVMRFEVEGGQTAIVDALYLAAERVSLHRRNCSACRRAVVVITDGEERGSARTRDSLINLLRRENVEVYFLAFVDNLMAEKGFITRSGREKSENFIEDISRASGGAFIYVKSAEGLKKSASQMITLMDRHYLAEYVPRSAGPVKKLEIRLAKTSKRKDITLHYRRP